MCIVQAYNERDGKCQTDVMILIHCAQRCSCMLIEANDIDKVDGGETRIIRTTFTLTILLHNVAARRLVVGKDIPITINGQRRHYPKVYDMFLDVYDQS